MNTSKTTRYVALLRGINVGGNKTVSMAKLKTVFEKLGYTEVVSYINSGNMLFASNKTPTVIVKELERAFVKAFGFEIALILRSAAQIKKLAKAIPAAWTNDTEQRTEVLFLWEAYDSKKTLTEIVQNPDVDRLKYFSGAIVWNIARSDVGKSGLRKFIGTKIYKNMTGRNVNTVRKLALMMGAHDKLAK